MLIGNSTGNTLTKSTLTAGTGITITNGTGSITIDAAAGQIQTQLFTAPGTWTCPATTTQVRVTVIGGGGAGGRNSAGGTGGTSSFGPFASATGGAGGASSSPGNTSASPGTGSTTGTAIRTLNVTNEVFGLFQGTSLVPGPSGPVAPYTQNSSFIAGAGGATSPESSQGGRGGAIIALTPVSAPVTVTVGAGGAKGDPIATGSVGGAVLVEFVG